MTGIGVCEYKCLPADWLHSTNQQELWLLVAMSQSLESPLGFCISSPAPRPTLEAVLLSWILQLQRRESETSLHAPLNKEFDKGLSQRSLHRLLAFRCENFLFWIHSRNADLTSNAWIFSTWMPFYWIEIIYFFLRCLDIFIREVLLGCCCLSVFSLICILTVHPHSTQKCCMRNTSWSPKTMAACRNC